MRLPPGWRTQRPAVLLLLLFVLYSHNQAALWLPGIVAQPMAQDIGFGDYACRATVTGRSTACAKHADAQR